MSGYSVQIKPGPAQQISGGPPAQNSTIYNQDLENSVWIGNTQAVTPNNGMLLGPQGTLQWISKGQPWGCVDTGVVTNVQLTISDDVNNIQNPVAIAEAIAIAGIPNTLIQDVLFNSVIAGGGSFNLDVSKYATIIILSDTTAIGGVGPSFSYLWLDAANNVLYSDVMNSLKGAPGSGCIATIELPVISSNIAIVNNNGVPQSFIVYGTNRITPEVTVPTFSQLTAFTTGSIAWVPGQIGPLNSVGADASTSQNQSRYKGDCFMTVTLTGTPQANVASSELAMRDSDGQVSIVMMDGSEFHTIGGHARCYKTFIHPRVPMGWSWTSQSTFTYAISIALSGL